MLRFELEVLTAAFVPQSAEGGLPDVWVEATLLAPNGTQRQLSTSTQIHTREPKWCEVLVFDAVDSFTAVSGCATPQLSCRLRLLEKLKGGSAPPLVLGEHTLAVGGLRRSVGCAWVAMKDGVLHDESPAPIPDTLALRIMWSLTVDNEAKQPSADNRSFATSSVVRLPAEGGQKGPEVKLPEAPLPAAAAADESGALAQRVKQLEERVDHLDSLFRTRRDYEAEVQRIMLEKAADAVNAAQSASDAAMMKASMVSTPSAALAMATAKQASQTVADCQPKLISVGPTTSPYLWYRPPPSAAAVSSPSAAQHFPLRMRNSSPVASALQSILLDPTIVSNDDKQLVSANTYRPVELPRPRLIGFVPAHQVKAPSDPIMGSLLPVAVSTTAIVPRVG